MSHSTLQYGNNAWVSEAQFDFFYRKKINIFVVQHFIIFLVDDINCIGLYDDTGVSMFLWGFS
jgi:hypothetical protein